MVQGRIKIRTAATMAGVAGIGEVITGALALEPDRVAFGVLLILVWYVDRATGR